LEERSVVLVAEAFIGSAFLERERWSEALRLKLKVFWLEDGIKRFLDEEFYSRGRVYLFRMWWLCLNLPKMKGSLAVFEASCGSFS
jgi:hypothetical protein